MSDDPPRPTLSSALVYQDPKAALRFLESAFGFEPTLVLLDAQDEVAHSEMRLGGGMIMVGREWSQDHKSPASLGGKNTQSLHIYLGSEDGGLDAHCERARAAGARILAEPETQFYGDRTYRAVDPEGHIFTFSQTLEHVPVEAYEGLTGLKAKTRL